MAFNGSGTFVINTAGQPVVPNTVISATAFNALTNDLANGLSTCITKDGQTTPTANIPMGNNKITGLAPGTSGTDAANLTQVQGSTAKLLQSVTGTDTITAAMVPALTAYAAGQMFYFVAAGDNTGAVTINIDSLGAKSVTRDGSVALVAGDILSGEIALVVYDGTRFQLLNGNSFTNLYVSGNLGVGTASPAQKLSVQGGLTVTGSATLPAAQGPLLFSFESPFNRCYMGDGTGYSFAFSKRTASTTTDLVTLTDTGNLGIGTTSPGQKLEVSGNQRFTGSQVGTKIENRNTGINVSTATTILDEAGAHGRFVIVNGANGGDRFCDLVFCSTAANPTVIASFTAFGTPTARTYTRNGSELQLAMASGTYVVNALALGY